MDTENTTNLEDIRSVSYSQYSWWMKCPHKWYLDFVKGLRKFEDSINTCFGTAMHEVLQKYVETLYNEGINAATELNLNKMFSDALEREIKDKEVPVTEDELGEFIQDGRNIISAFCDSTVRIANFPNKKYQADGEGLGVELEIITELVHNVKFKAYIDLVLKDKTTGRIKIWDFKTSSVGWNSYMKDDETKYSQLLLYKAFYAQKYNVPLHMVDIEFFILKRKLYENYNFPQSRIQKFIPEHNNKMVAAAVNGFGEFVRSCFNEDGSFIEDEKNYPKFPGKGKKHCKWCPHKKVDCDAKETKLDSD